MQVADAALALQRENKHPSSRDNGERVKRTFAADTASRNFSRMRNSIVMLYMNSLMAIKLLWLQKKD